MMLDPYVGDSIRHIQKATVSSLQPGNWSDVVRRDGGLDKVMLPRVYEEIGRASCRARV